LKLIQEMPIKSARIRPTCMHCEGIGTGRQSVERMHVLRFPPLRMGGRKRSLLAEKNRPAFIPRGRARHEDVTLGRRRHGAQPSAPSPQP